MTPSDVLAFYDVAVSAVAVLAFALGYIGGYLQ